MRYQDTERELLTLGNMRVRLSGKESFPYGVEYTFTIGKDSRVADVEANFNCFPSISRVSISYDITAEIITGIHGANHFSRRKILLAVYCIINEAYLSYTEKLITEAKPSLKENEIEEDGVIYKIVSHDFPRPLVSSDFNAGGKAEYKGKIWNVAGIEGQLVIINKAFYRI
jgi:hypothetical protein